MAAKTHYEVLGVRENASKDEIRRAYRRLVLKLHPDRSGDKATTERFMRVADAYRALSDPKRREDYNAALRYRRERKGRRPRAASSQRTEYRKPKTENREPHRPLDLATRVAQAAALFSQGRYAQAEAVALLVVRQNPRLAMPHAILGDIARAKQNLPAALKHYAYAVQLNPKNTTFQRRYEQLLNQVGSVDIRGKIEPVTGTRAPVWVAAGLSGLMLVYVAIAREAPLLDRFLLLGSWTAGLLVMMFVNGVIVGATLAITQSVDRWESVARGSSGRMSPAAALGLVALVNFWASAFLYVFLGMLQDSFTYSVSRLVTVVGALTLCFALMSALSPTILWHQTLLWGGNVVYVGALCGWAVADAFR
ncbi:MAG: DnaJ domain-containing protein [Armatimonadetes bacterium]|nr:DnaJ domain-containing protein [Armatimonadota bacterium]